MSPKMSATTTSSAWLTALIQASSHLLFPETTVVKVVRVLEGLGVCGGCTLRFLGIRPPLIGSTDSSHIGILTGGNGVDNASDGTDKTTTKETLSTPGNPSNPWTLFWTGISATKDTDELAKVSSPCRGCLGILALDSQALAKKASLAFQQERYQLGIPSYLVASRLPPSLAIRQRSLSLMLEHECALDFQDGQGTLVKSALPEPIQVKDALKHAFCDAFTRETGLAFDSMSPLTVTLAMDHPETELQCDFMTAIPEADFRIKKARAKGRMVIHGASYEKIRTSADKLTYQHFLGSGQLPPPPVSTMPSVEITFLHAQVWVAGRYTKLRRHISNSPWEIHGKRLTEHSVEELIGDSIDACFRVDSHKFSSAGREDADVLMLGTGRPFYYELVNPRHPEPTMATLAALEQSINAGAKGLVGVRDLQVVTRQATSVLKESASTKSKSYSCVVRLSEPVALRRLEEVASATVNLPVAQRNPTRVPRRADLVRNKVIESMAIRPVETTDKGDRSSTPSAVDIIVDLKTSAGTYVKEFVHGDEGRTVPCLASLLGVESAQVVSLDVTAVHLDWPPALSYEEDSSA